MYPDTPPHEPGDFSDHAVKQGEVEIVGDELIV